MDKLVHLSFPFLQFRIFPVVVFYGLLQCSEAGLEAVDGGRGLFAFFCREGRVRRLQFQNTEDVFDEEDHVPGIVWSIPGEGDVAFATLVPVASPAPFIFFRSDQLQFIGGIAFRAYCIVLNQRL